MDGAGCADTADVCGLLFDLLTGADDRDSWDGLVILPFFFTDQLLSSERIACDCGPLRSFDGLTLVLVRSTPLGHVNAKPAFS